MFVTVLDENGVPMQPFNNSLSYNHLILVCELILVSGVIFTCVFSMDSFAPLLFFTKHSFPCAKN